MPILQNPFVEQHVCPRPQHPVHGHFGDMSVTHIKPPACFRLDIRFEHICLLLTRCGRGRSVRGLLLGLCRALPRSLTRHGERVCDERGEPRRVDRELAVPASDAHVGCIVATGQSTAVLDNAEQRAEHPPLANLQIRGRS